MNRLATNPDGLGSLVFPRDKSRNASPHEWGCWVGGAAFVFSDGTTAPLRSKASNRCPGCARAAAFENMTMLRMDAEDNSAPRYVLTLTSVRVDFTSKEYGRACQTFWEAFRRRWGRAIEYCGFIEWTTGEGPRSGGERRMHSHWLIKADGLDVDAVQAWVSDRWRRLTGAWVVQLAELRHAGGVVGYLALHHEKMEQAPPAGWTGRRLRPSKGYFAEPGDRRRARARAWLAEQRENAREWPRPFGEAERPKLVWRRMEWERAADAATIEPGRSADTLPERAALARRLADPDAPIAADWLSALAQDEQHHRAMYRAELRRRARELADERAAFRDRETG